MSVNEKYNSICPACGTEFDCGAKSGRETCWCFNLPNVMPVDSKQDCLCPQCLKKRIDEHVFLKYSKSTK